MTARHYHAQQYHTRLPGSPPACLKPLTSEADSSHIGWSGVLIQGMVQDLRNQSEQRLCSSSQPREQNHSDVTYSDASSLEGIAVTMSSSQAAAVQSSGRNLEMSQYLAAAGRTKREVARDGNCLFYVRLWAFLYWYPSLCQMMTNALMTVCLFVTHQDDWPQPNVLLDCLNKSHPASDTNQDSLIDRFGCFCHHWHEDRGTMIQYI